MVKELRAFLAVWVVVVLAVLGLRAFAVLQPFELRAYDFLLSKLERPSSVSDRIALIEIREADIQTLGRWPLTDLQLAVLLESILDAGANAVGLDIYRDLPVPPGTERLERLLERDHRIVLVFKHGDPATGGIPVRTELEGTGRLGFSDLVLDPDSRVRRGLLFMDREDGGTDLAFALQLALRDLARDGIGLTPDPVREEWLLLGETSIPYLEAGDGGYADVDDRGYQTMLDFHQSDGGFEFVSFREALLGELESGSLAGRIVLVGANAESLHDFALVPEGIGHGSLMERGASGVWIQASSVDQILRFARGESKPLRFVSNFWEDVGISAAALLGCLFAVSVGAFTRFAAIGLAAGAAAGVALLAVLAYQALAMGVWIPVVAPALAWMGASAAQTAWMSGRERAQRAELMRIFSQVQSPRVADELWRRRNEYLVDGQLAPEAATVTVLFLDMKGYTASAEKMAPGELMSWINEFMAPMARLIEEHGGYPDDYFGDGIKADFGVPVLCETEAEIADTARDAIRCSLAMVEELGRINAGYAKAGLPTVALRIGIHTGPVVVGLLGSRNKGKYTVVGEAVVTAQRLESTDKVEHDFEREPCRILLSERTYSSLDQTFLDQHGGLGRFDFKGEIALKGKAAHVSVYALRTASD